MQKTSIKYYKKVHLAACLKCLPQSGASLKAENKRKSDKLCKSEYVSKRIFEALTNSHQYSVLNTLHSGVLAKVFGMSRRTINIPKDVSCITFWDFRVLGIQKRE